MLQPGKLTLTLVAEETLLVQEIQQLQPYSSIHRLHGPLSQHQPVEHGIPSQRKRDTAGLDQDQPVEQMEDGKPIHCEERCQQSVETPQRIQCWLVPVVRMLFVNQFIV